MSARDHLQHEQLRMFMSAREIMSRYDPHEGDRETKLDRGGGDVRHLPLPWQQAQHRERYGKHEVPDPRGGMLTGRAFTTDGQENWRNRGPGVNDSNRYKRPHTTMMTGHLRPETNEEMWERKGKEADERGYTESIAEKGVIQPVPLTSFTHSGSREMVGGGQHRIAASMRTDPERLMPVLHHQDILKAVRDQHYRYT